MGSCLFRVTAKITVETDRPVRLVNLLVPFSTCIGQMPLYVALVCHQESEECDSSAEVS